VRSEDVRLCTGWAALLTLCTRECIKQDVNSHDEKSVHVELLHHVSLHLEDELNIFWCQEAR
jgi:hypothetical protein